MIGNKARSPLHCLTLASLLGMHATTLIVQLEGAHREGVGDRDVLPGDAIPGILTLITPACIAGATDIHLPSARNLTQDVQLRIALCLHHMRISNRGLCAHTLPCTPAEDR